MVNDGEGGSGEVVQRRMLEEEDPAVETGAMRPIQTAALLCWDLN